VNTLPPSVTSVASCSTEISFLDQFVSAGEKIPAGDENSVPGGVGILFSIEGKRPRRNGTRTTGRDTRKSKVRGPRSKNAGTGLEPWDGTQTVGRDSNRGTGLKRWDGTQTVGRDTNRGTGHERWDGTANRWAGRKPRDGTQTVGRDTFMIRGARRSVTCYPVGRVTLFH